MNPFDERELSRMLREWKAPGAPPTLRDRVMGGREAWWRWLLTGTIRIPVPVGVAAVLLLSAWMLLSGSDATPPAAEAPSVSLADFQPVAEFEPVVVGGQK